MTKKEKIKKTRLDLENAIIKWEEVQPGLRVLEAWDTVQFLIDDLIEVASNG